MLRSSRSTSARPLAPLSLHLKRTLPARAPTHPLDQHLDHPAAMSSSEHLPVQIPDGFAPLGTSGTRLLEIERAKASFSPAELREYIYGNEYLERQSRILPIVENEVRLVPPLVLPAQARVTVAARSPTRQDAR